GDRGQEPRRRPRPARQLTRDGRQERQASGAAHASPARRGASQRRQGPAGTEGPPVAAASGARRIVNLAGGPLTRTGNAQRLRGRIARIGRMMGLRGLGCTLTVVPPGKRAYPFNRHHVFSEMIYVLSGAGEVRLNERRLPLRAGDVIAHPPGAEAHQIINTGSEELRYLALSDFDEVDVIDYPDSGKMGVAARVKGGHSSPVRYHRFGRVTAADYLDGEEPPK